MPTTKDGLLLDKRRYGVGIAWTDVGKEVDLDLQAVIVDDRGRIADAVYYNNLTAMSGAVQHTGDLGNSSETVGEMIWVVLKKLPPRVQMIIFVLAAYNSNARLKDAMHGRITVCAEFTGQILKTMSMEETSADVDVVAMMVKVSDGTWRLKDVDVRAHSGQNFLDILEPTIGTLIRDNVEGAPAEQKVIFDTTKGKSDHQLDPHALRRLNFTVVGELADSLRRVDIDVSAVFYNANGNNLGAVYCDNQDKFGVVHGGDSAKDEDLTVDLHAVPDKVQQIFLLVHVFTEGRTFADMRNVQVMISNQSLEDLFVCSIPLDVFERGLVVARLNRKLDCSWGFEPINRFCHGPAWKDCLPELEILFEKSSKRLRNELTRADASSNVLPRLSMLTVQTFDDMGSSTDANCDLRRMISGSFPISDTYAAQLGLNLVADATVDSSVTKVMIGKRTTGMHKDLALLKAALCEKSSESASETEESVPFAV
eukprot:TRINITY_DN4236_c0_g1_i1.p1 TRINITY_DN4236_c0_g1~~TRINITY_DN4236_c0_g1_i1.p1  ORF type:complete len:482 (+),score=88.92 TRINITY_DN4236_c0_g1_i1:50-1495(+)